MKIKIFDSEVSLLSSTMYDVYDFDQKEVVEFILYIRNNILGPPQQMRWWLHYLRCYDERHFRCKYSLTIILKTTNNSAIPGQNRSLRKKLIHLWQQQRSQCHEVYWNRNQRSTCKFSITELASQVNPSTKVKQRLNIQVRIYTFTFHNVEFVIPGTRQHFCNQQECARNWEVHCGSLRCGECSRYFFFI